MSQKVGLKTIVRKLGCFRKVAHNTCIYDIKNKTMKATALGIWYVQIPNNYIINPFGDVIQPKVYKGNKVIIFNRKQISVSKLPHLDYFAAMNFKKIFCYFLHIQI